ncbi:MAG TPA: GNAT family N-acetyltransferase [Thermoanaerobaculia bacterium]|nr:GNAT family N-acetyltransferase [Thermoanaerobaculia bacterium]
MTLGDHKKRNTGEVIAILPGSQAALGAANWIEDEWPGIPIIEWLRTPSPVLSEFPVVLGFSDTSDGSLLGCGALLLRDMDDRPDLDPWLGCLYVATSARRCGIARRLTQALAERAQKMAISTLYLFCDPTLRAFYESEGWSSIEERSYEGKPCVVMARRIYEY